MHFSCLFRHLTILALCASALIACTDVPATNPFDPGAPEELQRKVTLQGAVIDAESEEAIVGAVVTLTGPSNPENNPIITIQGGNVDDGANSTGTYRFEQLLPGRYRLEVVHAGHIRQVVELGRLGAGEEVQQDILMVPLPIAGDAEMIELPPEAGRISGVAHRSGELVRPDDEQDHSGITVEVEDSGLRTVTNRRGDFDLFLNAGTYNLVLSTPDHHITRREEIVVAESEEVVLGEPIVMEPNPGTINGVALLQGASSEGNAGITVTLANTSLTAQTDDSGAYQLTDIPAGVYTIRALKEGYDEVSTSGVVVRGGRDTESIALALPISRGSIQGMVGLAAAQSNQGIAINLTNTGFGTFTNTNGAYRVDGIPVGQYTVQACKQGYEPTSFANVEVTADGVTTAPRLDEPSELARQQVRVSQDGEVLTTNALEYRLNFAEVPAWVNAVRVSGVSQGDLAQGHDEGFVPYDADQGGVNLQLSAGDGAKQLSVQFRGDGCYLSDAFQVAIIVDQTGPELSNLRLVGALETPDGLLTNRLDLTMEAQLGDATEIQVRGDLASAGGEAANLERWIPASHSLVIRLDDVDGLKEVSLGARDAAGNLARPNPTLSARIRLDRTPPQNAAIRVVGAEGLPLEEDGIITNPRVSLQLNVRGAHEMQLADDAAFTDAAWLPVEPTAERSVRGPNEDGPKTIFARFRDQAGNTTDAVSVRVNLDRIGQIAGTISTDCAAADLTAARVFVDGVPQRSPGPNGGFILRDISIGAHEVSVELEDYEASEAIDVSVGPEATDREPTFELTNRFGRLNYTLNPEASRTCAATEVLIDGVATVAPREGCTFRHGQLTTGFHELTIQRSGFEDAVELVNIPSCGLLELGEIPLERSSGTVTGVVRLQSQGDSSNAGTIISFRSISPVGDGAIGQEAFCAVWDECGYQQDCAQRYTSLSSKDYRRVECFFEAMAECVQPIQEIVNACPIQGLETVVTDSSGSFTRDLQVGHYVVSAEQEGYTSDDLGTFTIIADGVTAITPDGPAILSQQTGDFDINGGAAFTRSHDVTLSMEFNDVVGFKYRINGGDFPRGVPTQWQDPDADGMMEFSLRLNGADGVKRIEIMTIDVDGVESGAPYYTASITLDTQAPANAELEIDGGAEYTNSSNQNVTLTLNASDVNGVDRVILTHLQNCPNPESARGYSPLLNYQLNGDTDGRKRVTACFVDPAGNVSGPVSANIILDRTPPNIQAFGVRDFAGQSCTNGCVVNSREVSLLLSEGGGGDTREVWITRDDPTFTTGAWQPKLPGPFEFVLPRDAADYDVYLKARDAAGNVVGDTEATRLLVSIRLDNEAPPAPIATLSATWLNQRDFSVTFANTAEATDIEMSPDVNFEQVVNSQEADGNLAYALPQNTPQGPRTLYFRYRDAAGNVGPSTALELIYDTEAPSLVSAQVGFAEPNAIAYINDPRDVPVQSLCVDDLAGNRDLELRVGRGQSAIDVPYSPLVFLAQVPGPDGVAQFDVRCTDAAGNVSEPQTVVYTLDSTAPVPRDSVVMVANGQVYTRSRTVTVDIEGVDNAGGSGISHMAVGESSQIECGTANYQVFVPRTTVTLPAADNLYVIRVCLKDAAGNGPAVLSTDITLDTTAPTGDFVFGVQDRASQTHSKTRAIMLRASSNNAVKMAGREGIPECDAIPSRNRLAFTDQARELNLQTEGLHSVSLCLYDVAGNATRVTKQITVDETRPTGNMDINRGAEATNTRDVTINLSAAADVTQMHVAEVNGPAEARHFSCDDLVDADLVPLDLAHEYTLQDGDGPKGVVVCLKDAAGWTIKLPNAGDGEYAPALITLDTTGPSLNQLDLGGVSGTGILIGSGDTLINDPDLRLHLRASDATMNVAQYKLSDNDACTGGTWQDWSALTRQGVYRIALFEVDDGDNVARDVSVVFRDSVGNESACGTDDITVDTVPLTLSRFLIAGQAGDAPGYTRSQNIKVTDIATVGAGGCARYELSESQNFEPKVSIPANAGACATAESGNGASPPLNYALADGTNGLKTLYARVRDAAGNYSPTLSATIELDGERPTLAGVTVQKNPDAIRDGEDGNGNVLPIHLNSRDVIVQPQEPEGGVRMRYQMLEDASNNCDDAQNLPNEIDYVGPFSIRFNSDGPKRLCLTIDDEVGNFSLKRNVDFVVDTEPPPAPALPNGNLAGVNASCAFVKSRRAENLNFWKFQFRNAGGIWRDLTAAHQNSNDLFNPSQPNDVAYIRFPLTQDTDNLLQVRVVDYAGNVSEASQVIVEEVSSYLIPTDLKLKQICNGGEYGILKQELNQPATHRRSGCFPSTTLYTATPAMAVVDLDRLTTRQLTPTLGLDELSVSGCENAAMNNSLIDAACSSEAGESPLLLIRPRSSYDPDLEEGCAQAPNCPGAAIALEGPRGVVELSVMPDPIGNPAQALVPLAPVGGIGADVANRYALNSIDVLDWTGDIDAGDYGFQALGTDVDLGITVAGHGGLSNSWETNLRFLSFADGDGLVSAGGVIDSISDVGQYYGQRSIFGLSARDHRLGYYMKFELDDANGNVDPAWRVKKYTNDANGNNSESFNYNHASATLDDRSEIPFRNRIGPANYCHTPEPNGEANANMLYRTAGGAAAKRYNPTGRPPQVVPPKLLGSGAPANAAFVDLKYSVDANSDGVPDTTVSEVHWVDVADPRIIYQNSEYGLDPVRLRYAVDTALPIYPAVGSEFGLGDPYIIYHTTGVTTGLVITYRDENNARESDCAE